MTVMKYCIYIYIYIYIRIIMLAIVLIVLITLKKFYIILKYREQWFGTKKLSLLILMRKKIWNHICCARNVSVTFHNISF